MPRATLEALTFGLAAVVAMRSTWSPCGISMLSTLTPLGERARGHRYGVTVWWFVVGAVVGGAVLGGALAGLAAAVGALHLTPGLVQAVAVAAAAVTIASDVGLGGFHLPRIPRQVDENWTGRYRHWVYALGFGAQIGVGVSTYVMTAGVYLTMVLAGLTGRPLVALGAGVGFGLVRGLAILLGVRLTTPEAIRRFHRGFEGAASWSLLVAVVAQFAVLMVAAGVAPGVTVAAAGGGLLVAAVVHARRPWLS